MEHLPPPPPPPSPPPPPPAGPRRDWAFIVSPIPPPPASTNTHLRPRLLSSSFSSFSLSSPCRCSPSLFLRGPTRESSLFTCSSESKPNIPYASPRLLLCRTSHQVQKRTTCPSSLVSFDSTAVKMVYSLTYTRPPRRTFSQSSLSDDEKQHSIDESIRSHNTCQMCQGIPEALSFDRIISGGTCPVRLFPRCCLPPSSMHSSSLVLPSSPVPCATS